MKPRTRIQKEIAQLSKRLPKLSKAQRAYAFEHCFKHYPTEQRKVSSLVWSADTNGRVNTIWRRVFAVVLVLIVANSWKCWIPERECSEKWNTSALSPLASSTRYSVTSVQRCTARSDNRQNTPSRRLCKDGLHPMARPRPLPDCVV